MIFLQEVKDRYFTIIKAFYDEGGEDLKNENFIDNYLIVGRIPNLFKNPWGNNYSEDLVKHILDEDDRLDVCHFQSSEYSARGVLCVGIKEEIMKRNYLMQKMFDAGKFKWRIRK